MALSAPNTVKQKKGGFCLAACYQSLDNTWGGNYTQDDSGIDQNSGYVNYNNSLVTYETVTASYSGIKNIIDEGNYCLMYMNGYGHWVVAYAATATSADSIDVMDPYEGNLITLEKAMSRFFS